MSAGLNSSTKFTKWTIFRDGLAKTTKLTIFTIFGHGFRTIQPNFYPFQSGPAYFTILTEIAKFTNFVFFRQIFMRICHNVSPFVLYIITVADPGERPERPGRPGTPIFRPKGRPKFFETPLPLPPPPPFPLSEGLDPALNNTSSKQHCCYATFYKWSTPCKFWLQRRRNMGKYAFDLFCRYFRNFRNFGCFFGGLPWPLIRMLKALQNFVIFVIFAIFVTL